MKNSTLSMRSQGSGIVFNVPQWSMTIILQSGMIMNVPFES